MKKTGAVLFAIIVLSLVLATFAPAEPNMQEGMWEIKGEIKMEGLPFPMPPIPMTFTQCLTKKDMVPQKKEKGQDCKTVKNEIVGNMVSWVMQCKDKNGVTDSTGEITYKGNSFAGPSIRSQWTQRGQNPSPPCRCPENEPVTANKKSF